MHLKAEPESPERSPNGLAKSKVAQANTLQNTLMNHWSFDGWDTSPRVQGTHNKTGETTGPTGSTVSDNTIASRPYISTSSGISGSHWKDLMRKFGPPEAISGTQVPAPSPTLETLFNLPQTTFHNEFRRRVPYANAAAKKPIATGQAPAPGTDNHIMTIPWEEEGTSCYYVEVGGICVARRQDNNWINATKLLTAADWVRGRRDGMMKAETVRHVVTTGPNLLKGVWVPFDRALVLATRENIAGHLYPLLVYNIAELLQPSSIDAGASDSPRARTETYIACESKS